MPITFQPSTVALSPVNYLFASQPLDLVPQSIKKTGVVGEIYQSNYASRGSFSARSNATIVDLSKVQIKSQPNGFVAAAVDAYSNHNHLVLSPDDVWLAILSQFNLYVNANSEQLRNVFVNFTGKKTLTVYASGTRYNVDFGGMAQRMTKVIEENVRDPGLRSWIIPDFSTTTDNDRIVASVTMMATLKSYFSYVFSLRCGLPKVTLLGEKHDWEKILEKSDKLKDFGKDTTEWHRMLKPVLSRFVYAFEQPNSKQNLDYWQQIAHHQVSGSGQARLSGWITAFCFFDAKGQPLYDSSRVSRIAENPNALNNVHRLPVPPAQALQLDNVTYYSIDASRVPPAFAEVDVTLDDNGTKINTIMIAGHLGIKTSSSSATAAATADVSDDQKAISKQDTVQPTAGWFIAKKEETSKNPVSMLLRSVDFSSLFSSSMDEKAMAFGC